MLWQNTCKTHPHKSIRTTMPWRRSPLLGGSSRAAIYPVADDHHAWVNVSVTVMNRGSAVEKTNQDLRATRTGTDTSIPTVPVATTAAHGALPPGAKVPPPGEQPASQDVPPPRAAATLRPVRLTFDVQFLRLRIAVSLRLHSDSRVRRNNSRLHQVYR